MKLIVMCLLAVIFQTRILVSCMLARSMWSMYVLVVHRLGVFVIRLCD